MFAARGLAVSFSVFAMVYCVLSLAVCLGWRSIWLRSSWPIQRRRLPLHRIADRLLAVRMFPLITAAVITAVFTVPSFLLLEPRAIDEPMSGVSLALGICGAGLGIFGVVNASLALRRASRTISIWTINAQTINARTINARTIDARNTQLVDSSSSVPMLRITPASPLSVIPPLSAVGIVRPRILLSGAAESLLTANELKTALNHELAHVRRRDNLKKLLLRFIAFPGMAALEGAWLETTEMASDDAAVSNAREALDLAAALIKLSRLAPVVPPTDLTAALVHSPASIMNARVERLIRWSELLSEDRLPSNRGYSPWYGLAVAVVTVAAFAFTYSQLIASLHTATEWLVR
jgi:Zn-dependent protease with chaperone function